MGTPRRSRANSVSRDYLSVLECYWNGRPQTALERLSQMIADDPDHSDKLKLYRLWIEVLANLDERETMRSLVDHLHLLSLMEPNLSAAFMALRGIIYLEIDDFAAAGLCMKAVARIPHCDYCDELKYRMRRRISAGHVYSDLVGRVARLDDYFHLQTVAFVAQQKVHKPLLERVSTRLQRLFPKSPLMSELKMHTAFEQRNYHRGELFAADLYAKFPGNFDYAVYNAYAAAYQGKFKHAITVLERAHSMGADRDIDVNALLSNCYGKMFQETGDQHWQQKFDRAHDKARELAKEIGVEMIDYTNKKSNAKIPHDQTVPALWMVKVDANEFFKLRDEKTQHQTTMRRALDEQAKPGDLVVFAGSDYRQKRGGKPEWRLAAVYQVDSEPTWHPLDGFTVSMELVSRPRVSIPFDVQFTDGKTVETGVINLDLASVDLIADKIREFQDLDAGAGRIVQEFEKAKMIS